MIMATQGSMICERNCLLVMAKWSDLQPACPHSPFLRLSPQLTPPRVYKEHRKILKQRLPDTAKGKRSQAGWGGHFSSAHVCPVPTAASPEHSERNITHSWQPFSLLRQHKSSPESCQQSDCTCCGHNLQILLPFWDHSLIFQGCHSDEDLQRACQRGALGGNVLQEGELNED